MTPDELEYQLKKENKAERDKLVKAGVLKSPYYKKKENPQKRGAKKGVVRSYESLCLTNLKAGDEFFSVLPDKDITARAAHMNVKVKTQRLVCIHPISLETFRITKVTIL